MNDIRSSVYAQKVELLLRLIPIVMEEEVFAIHGGTAINLFLKDLPRYSVDIDLTYIPLANRQTSLDDINLHLKSIADKAKKAFKGMHVVPNFNTSSNPQPIGFRGNLLVKRQKFILLYIFLAQQKCRRHEIPLPHKAT